MTKKKSDRTLLIETLDLDQSVERLLGICSEAGFAVTAKHIYRARAMLHAKPASPIISGSVRNSGPMVRKRSVRNRGPSVSNYLDTLNLDFSIEQVIQQGTADGFQVSVKNVYQARWRRREKEKLDQARSLKEHRASLITASLERRFGCTIEESRAAYHEILGIMETHSV